MNDRDRVLRRVKDARQSAENLAKASKTEDLQHAWERWTMDWRIAADLLETYGQRNTLASDRLDLLMSSRKDDLALVYIWECGNAERHNPGGSADATRGMAINAADRNRGVYIQSLIVSGGQIVEMKGDNMALDLDVGSLSLRTVQGKGRRLVAPPEGAGHQDLLRAGAKYLSSLQALVCPSF